VGDDASDLFKTDMERWNSILKTLEPLKKLGWKDYGHGNVQLGHEPKDYPMYYHIILYEPLDLKTIKKIESQTAKTPYYSTRNFYFMSNGISLFEGVNLFGIVGNSYTKVGQPISLTYGNVYEVPIGLPLNSMVIGGITATHDRNDYLISHADGRICQSHGFEEYQEVRDWLNIFDFLEEIIVENMATLELS